MLKKLIIILIVISAISLYFFGRSLWHPIYSKIAGRRTVEEVVEKHQTNVKSTLSKTFHDLSISYPPKNIALIGLKQERILQLWVSNNGDKYHLIKSYPFTAFSGKIGPKLASGDRQIPEGVYGITFLNPNSSYHLSIKVGYPNQHDLKYAKIDSRNSLGGDIFIHGKAVTIGCIPIGDSAIEELFTLTALVGIENSTCIISPYNFLTSNKEFPASPVWLSEKYNRIKKALHNIARI